MMVYTDVDDANDDAADDVTADDVYDYDVYDDAYNVYNDDDNNKDDYVYVNYAL